jgi:hypothetical protein
MVGENIDLSNVNVPKNSPKPFVEQNIIGDLNNDLNIEVVESTNMFDATKYEGKKVRIGKVEKLHVLDLYPDGVYDPQSQEMKWAIKITTEPLKELDENGNFTDKIVTFKDKEGNVQPKIIWHSFNLQKMIDEKTHAEKWVISKHPKASLWAFMRKMGVTAVAELGPHQKMGVDGKPVFGPDGKPVMVEGKSVMLNTKLSTKEGEENRKFLIIVV